MSPTTRQRSPAIECIANGLGERTTRGDWANVFCSHCFEPIENRPRSGAPQSSTFGRVQVLRLGFNLVKVGNFQQGVLGDRGFLRFVHLEEFPARVRDTRSADLCLEKDATSRVRGEFFGASAYMITRLNA